MLKKILFNALFISVLSAEVENVMLTWNPIPCTHNCPILLQDRLKKARGVVSIQMHAEEGNAVMEWDKKIPFSFTPLNWALRYVGVREKSLRLKVTGTIHGSASSYTITSRGDNTNFVLFNRAVPSDPPQYVNQYNPSNRILSKDIIAKLEEIKKANGIAVIEGPIFMAERSPPAPLQLIVESVSLETPPDTAKTPPATPTTAKTPPVVSPTPAVKAK